MRFFEGLRKECIHVEMPPLYPRTKEGVLHFIAYLASRSPLLSHIKEEEIFHALYEREKIGSTGLEKSIAIPHCSLPNISDFVVGIVTLSDGIDFDSLDGEKTRLFVFIISPEEKRNEHIRLLSAISRIISDPKNVQEMLTMKDADALQEAFLRHVDVDLEVTPQKERSLFHIIVQEEERFNEILTLLTEIEDCSLTVVESRNAAEYLQRLPLFASFWSESRRGFSRIIIAVINNAFTNEVLRRLNLIINELEDKAGIMVTVQKLFYTDGSLIV
jgi:PTS system nitrogen regulatory IIA component